MLSEFEVSPDEITPEEIAQAQEVIKNVVSHAKSMERPIYRGQAKKKWKLLPGAVRRLLDTYGDNLLQEEEKLKTRLQEYHNEQLIRPMKIIDGKDKLSDIQRLSILQHQGAATGLLDFSEFPLVALWFACKDYLEEDGNFFILNIGNHDFALNSEFLEYENLFDTRPKVVYYEPSHSLGTRIIIQRSIFLIYSLVIEEQIEKRNILSVPISKEDKPSLLKYLARLGLSDLVIFGDVPGLATANTAKSPLQMDASVPEDYRERGRRAYQAGRYADALNAYRHYAKVRPNYTQPYCLIGDALTALEHFEGANLEYTRAIENIENIKQPMYLGEDATSPKKLIDEMTHALYYNRGNVRAAVGNHQKAVEDFDEALKYDGTLTLDLWKNKGNSKFVLGWSDEKWFGKAYSDFEKAWEIKKGSDMALAMGNCKAATGEFEEALAHYSKGVEIGSGRTALHCRQNADQTHRIIEKIGSGSTPLKCEKGFVIVEATHIQETLPPSFEFTGNKGNTGNTPSGMITAHGGKGYRGGEGFAVIIVTKISSHRKTQGTVSPK